MPALAPAAAATVALPTFRDECRGLLNKDSVHRARLLPNQRCPDAAWQRRAAQRSLGSTIKQAKLRVSGAMLRADMILAPAMDYQWGRRCDRAADVPWILIVFTSSFIACTAIAVANVTDTHWPCLSKSGRASGCSPLL